MALGVTYPKGFKNGEKLQYQRKFEYVQHPVYLSVLILFLMISRAFNFKLIIDFNSIFFSNTIVVW